MLKKTKAMLIATKENLLKLEGKLLQHLNSYNYLGTIVRNNGKIDSELNERISKTRRIYNALRRTLLGNNEMRNQINAEIYKRVVRPTLIYGSES